MLCYGKAESNKCGRISKAHKIISHIMLDIIALNVPASLENIVYKGYGEC